MILAMNNAWMLRGSVLYSRVTSGDRLWTGRAGSLDGAAGSMGQELPFGRFALAPAFSWPAGLKDRSGVDRVVKRGVGEDTESFLVRFWIRALAAGAWFVFSCLVGFVLTLVRWRDASNAHRFARFLSWGGVRALGIQVHVVGEENLLAAQPCVYVANHQSVVDILVLGGIYPPRTLVTGKKELLWIPVFGPMFYAMGNILLDRGRKTSAVAALGKAAERMRKERVSVWVFPEGHRNAERPMLPFKKGAFHLALQARVPVVPIVCGQHGRFLDSKRREARPGVVEVRVLEPIRTEGMPPHAVTSLLHETRRRMEEALQLADEGTRPLPV